MLDAFSNPGSFHKGNLHCHSTRSGADLSPEAVCRFYREHGYGFICLSDHFVEKYDFPITDTREFRTEGFTTLIGAEIHAPKVITGVDWHIVAAGLPLDFAPTPPEETGPELCARAAATGAFIEIPHPSAYHLFLEDAQTLETVHAVEVYNTICDRILGRGGGEYLLDQMLWTGRRVGAVAVDDAHRYRTDVLGGWTMVKADELTPEAIIEALKAGAYYASIGPEIHHIEHIDDGVSIECSPCVGAYLVGPSFACETVWGTEPFTRVRLPLEKFDGKWARLILRDAQGRSAYTNPLFLDS